MFRNTLAFAVLAAVALAAQASPLLGDEFGWNELLLADGIFHPEINSIESRSGEKQIIVGELSELLGQDGVLSTLYTNYMARFQKQAPMDPKKIGHFKDALTRIASHNVEAMNGEHSWTRGLTQFSDMSAEEFFATMTMNPEEMAALLTNETLSDPPRRPSVVGLPQHLELEYNDDPPSKDWRDSGRVTSVKDQGGCGSCTTFATTAQMETVYALFKSGATPPADLSPQELVDCSIPGQDICATGMWPKECYDFFKSDGSATWSAYPYESGQSGKAGKCRKAGKAHDVKAGNWYKAFSESEADIKKSVAGWGPIYVCINVDKGFMDFRGPGVYDGPCNNEGLHSVTVFGYGNQDGKDFWLIKNSWNTWWGDKGYIKIARGSNKCNIQQHPRIIMTN